MDELTFNNLVKNVEDVIKFSQGLGDEIHCNELLERWWDNKEWLYVQLGCKLIWESPEVISVNLSDSMKDEMFRVFLNDVNSYLRERDYESYDIENWYEWIYDNRAGFFDNTVVHPLPDTEMKHGMKLLRAFKFFNFSTGDIRHIQDLASQVIQQTKIEGILCFSIHPLDYLTMSETNYKWRSCHTLDGEYRSGNLSYMIDPSTVVCYLKSKNDTQLDRFPRGMLWNNKKWRVLLHIQKDLNIMYVNRQYPFESDELIHTMQSTNLMRSMHFGNKNCYEKNHGIREINGDVLNQNYFRLFGFIFDPKDMCSGDENSLQYNDLIFSPYYKPQYILPDDLYWINNNKESIMRNHRVEIGKAVPCLTGCGNTLTDSCDMICDHCSEQDDMGECCICGDHIYEGQGFGLDDDDNLYCVDCAMERGIAII